MKAIITITLFILTHVQVYAFLSFKEGMTKALCEKEIKAVYPNAVKEKDGNLFLKEEAFVFESGDYHQFVSGSFNCFVDFSEQLPKIVKTIDFNEMIPAISAYLISVGVDLNEVFFPFHDIILMSVEPIFDVAVLADDGSECIFIIKLDQNLVVDREASHKNWSCNLF